MWNPARSALLATFVVAIATARLMAHGNNPPYIAFWGVVSSEAAHCQRQLGESGKRCVESVLRHEMRCEDIAGSDCSDAARAAARAAALDRAGTAVAEVCSTAEVKELGFRDLSEAQTDMKLSCGVDSDAILALMAPVEDPAITQACRARLGVIARSLVRQALRGKRAALDRIVMHPVEIKQSERLALINDCRRRLATTRTRLADQVRTLCPQFESAAGRSAEAWLVDLELRVDCVVYASYIQSAFVCPFLPTPASQRVIQDDAPSW